jgi:acyl carrier protein
MKNNENEVFVYLKTLMLTFLDIDEAEITPDKSLSELNMESLDYVETQVAIQKTYGVKVDVSSLQEQGVKTIGDFVRCVQILRDQAAQAAASIAVAQPIAQSEAAP